MATIFLILKCLYCLACLLLLGVLIFIYWKLRSQPRLTNQELDQPTALNENEVNEKVFMLRWLDNFGL